MKCNAEKIRKAYQKSKTRAETLSKTMDVTHEGEVLAQTIKNSDKAFKLLDDKNFAALDTVDRSGVIANKESLEARRLLTDVFEGAIGQNVDSISERSSYMFKGMEYKDGLFNVKVSPLDSDEVFTYKFEKDTNVSKPSPVTRDRMYIPEFNNVTSSVYSKLEEQSKGVTRQENAKETKAAVKRLIAAFRSDNLGSADADSIRLFDYKKAKRKLGYKHGSVEHMKGLLADLHALEDNTITDDVFDYYNDLLDRMHPSFFRKMNLYINENAEHTHGWVDINKKHILLNVSSNTSSDMSNEEAYMHETIHTMTLWAIRNKNEDLDAAALVHRLRYLKEHAIKHMTWKDIFDADPNLKGKAGEDFARERYEYIFNSRHSDDEFLAFFLTNPVLLNLGKNIKLREKNSKGFLGAIKDLFNSIIDSVLGKYSFKNRNNTLNDEIYALAAKLADINGEYEMKSNEGNIVTKTLDYIDTLDENIAEKVHEIPEFLDRDGAFNMKKPDSLIGKAWFYTKFFGKAIYNEDYRNMAGHIFTDVGVKPTNSIRSVVRDLLPQTTEKNDDKQFLNLGNNNIDMQRNTHVAMVANNIIDHFTRKLIPREENALTSTLLEANANVLFNTKVNAGDGYSKQQLARIMTDSKFRARVRQKVLTRIKHNYKDRYNWISGQIEGLGKFMATGEGHEGLNTSSYNIAKGFLSNDRFKADPDLVTMIEEASALTALDYTDDTALYTTGDLILEQYDGVHNITNLYDAFKLQSREHLFNGDRSHMMDGYIKELFDDTIDVKYDLIDNADELESRGYKLVTTIAGSGLLKEGKIGVFVSSDYTKAERLRGAVTLSNHRSRGLTLKDVRYTQFGDDEKKHGHIYFENDKIRLGKKTNEINDRLAKGESIANIERGLIPILDASGNVVDYRGMMTKEHKEHFLKQDKSIISVLSKTSGTVIDKIGRETQNNKVLEAIKKDLKEYYDNDNREISLEEYTLITPDSDDPEIRKLFHMLPDEFQKFAHARKDNAIPVPSVLIDQYFGYEQYKITDMWGIRSLPTPVKHIIDMFEAYWMDLVKIVKGNILLKMPVVLVGNIISNALYALNTGVSPTEIYGMYKSSFRDVKMYMDDHKEYEKKKVELAALSQNYFTTKFSPSELADYRDEVKALQNHIARLEKNMSENKVSELFNLGLYQAVIEDVEMYKLGDTNRISDGMDKLLSKMPAILKTPAQWAYLSKDTAWYKVNQDILQMSDLIARDVMNRKLKAEEEAYVNGKKRLPLFYRKELPDNIEDKRRLKGAERKNFLKQSKKRRHLAITKAFVNYTLPNGQGEEFANRMGFLMFTKFLKWIQPVTTEATTHHFIRTSIMLSLNAFLLGLPMIQHSSLLYRFYDDNNMGIAGVLPTYGMFENLIKAFYPPAVAFVQEPTG